MKRQFQIITDSTSDILPRTAEKYGIDLVPLRVTFGSKSYLDKFEITNGAFYKKLAASQELPKTSMINPGEFCNVFEKYPDAPVIGIFIAAELSGTYHSACMARDMSGRDDIYIIDSRNTTAALALLVGEAVKLADAGVPAAEAAAILTDLSERTEIIAAVDTLKYLVKGGRISAVKGFVGGVLGIKPLVRVGNGVISQIGSERGMAKAMKKLRQEFYGKAGYDPAYPVVLVHADAPEQPEELRKILELSAGAAVLSVGSVVGTYSGPGAAGIGFIKKK